jgi:hypothetical protein
MARSKIVSNWLPPWAMSTCSMFSVLPAEVAAHL